MVRKTTGPVPWRVISFVNNGGESKPCLISPLKSTIVHGVSAQDGLWLAAFMPSTRVHQQRHSLYGDILKKAQQGP